MKEWMTFYPDFSLGKWLLNEKDVWTNKWRLIQILAWVHIGGSIFLNVNHQLFTQAKKYNK